MVILCELTNKNVITGLKLSVNLPLCLKKPYIRTGTTRCLSSSPVATEASSLLLPHTGFTLLVKTYIYDFEATLSYTHLPLLCPVTDCQWQNMIICLRIGWLGSEMK